jgi:hypothetical protein
MSIGSIRDASSGEGQQERNDREVTRLGRGVARWGMERDILKKAAAFFAKGSA